MTPTHTRAATWALVPLKASHRAKSRLAAMLDPAQRVELFFTLAERVIRALRQSSGIDTVAVVTSSREVASFAQSLGAVPMLQAQDVGMSPALELALQGLQTVQPARVLMVPGDLPLISATAVDELLSAASGSPNIVLVPDRHQEGTNALLCTPPQAMTLHFGQRSFARHLAAARAAGIATRVLAIDELALDLDCPDDLDYLRLHGEPSSMELFNAARSVAAGA